MNPPAPFPDQAPFPQPAQPVPRRAYSSSSYMSISCQWVGTGDLGNIPMLARASIVDYRGTILLDCMVEPTQPTVDYRTNITGLQKEHFATAVPFATVRLLCENLIIGKIIVGFQLWESLSVLNLSHPTINTRDLATYFPFCVGLRPDAEDQFRDMVWQYMRRSIRNGYVNPVEDARAAMDLFRTGEVEWEGMISASYWPCILPPASYAHCFL